MKLSHGILIILLLLLVGGVQADDPWSDWVVYGDAWKKTNSSMTVVMWNATGAHSWVSTGNASSVDYLAVAGGGGGASGGGGAGGLLTGTLTGLSGSNVVIVGSGGTARTGGQAVASANYGQNSSFANTTAGNGINALGGGAGATDQHSGSNGGSGGGAARGTTAGAGVAGQGYAGGVGTAAAPYTAGGGGGAGGTATGTNTINGGVGLSSSITGAVLWYAGGGGGCDISVDYGSAVGTGGSSIGGTGSTYNNRPGGSGVAGTGSGGGGASRLDASNYGSGGSGGSGVVIIRYLSTSSTIPIVQFVTDKTSVVFPGRIYFNDTSLNTPTQWNWSFGDGTWYNTTDASLGLNKSYQYVKRGVWVANLTVGNSAGTNTSADKAKSIRVIGYQGFVLPQSPSIWDWLLTLSAWLDNFIYSQFITY